MATTLMHVKIASGQATSGEVDLRELELVGFTFPAAFTGTSVGFVTAEKPSAEGGTYSTTTALSTGTGATVPVNVPATTSQSVWFNVNQLIGGVMLKVVSQAAEAADRDILLHVRKAQ